MKLKILLLTVLTIVGISISGCGFSDSSSRESGGTVENAMPVANAGRDQHVKTGLLVILDGTKSSDADGDPLTYSWSIISKPAGSTAVLTGSASERPTFTSDLDGVYEIELVVNDGKENSLPDYIKITATTAGGNSAPYANAGSDQNVKTNDTVNLDGVESTDVDGDPLTYSWSIVVKPAGSTATLSDNTSPRPQFIADKDGVYKIELIVNDGALDSLPDYIKVIATPGPVNAVPVADAGPDQNVKAGDFVILDGSASSDADGDPLTYSWSISSTPAGSAATLADSTSARPTFTADLEGTYVIKLIVNDGTDSSNADYVAVTATPGPVNAVPVANAGPDQNVKAGDFVILDGSASSDADGDPLTYSWSIASTPAGSAATLADSTSARPTFTPDLEGTYVIRLIVNDGTVDSIADYVAVTATPGPVNAVPVANAGPDQNVKTGTLVLLDGSGSSDADGDPLTYAWSISSQPAGSVSVLAASNTLYPTFTPDVEGTYVIQLIVGDGTVLSIVDQMVVNVTPGAVNAVPVANAGPDQNVKTGTLVLLDGSASSDADGDPLTYAWSISSQPAGSVSVLAASDTLYPTFTPDVEGTYVIQLIVGDGTVLSIVDQMVVNVTPGAVNTVPVANAGPDQNVKAGDFVILDGSASSDADGDPLTYSWIISSRPAGSTVGLTGSASARPTFRPDVDGTYVIRLIVNDGTVDSIADYVAVTATPGAVNAVPVANAGPDQNVKTGILVTLDGSGSSDADGDPLTYGWSIVSKPAGSGSVLAGGSTLYPRFTPDLDGTYVIHLIVGDGTALSIVDQVVVNVTISTNNAIPVANAGPDQSQANWDEVLLDGSASSDADGDPLTYSWSIVSKPGTSGVTLEAGLTRFPRFSPDRLGTYVIQLIVNDGTTDSAVDQVVVDVQAAP